MPPSSLASKPDGRDPLLSAALATSQAVLALQREADARQRAKQKELSQRLDEAAQTQLKLRSLIEEQKRTEAALREQQRYLDGLVANLPGMVYRCLNDQQWTMTFVSDGCLALTGYAKRELEQNHVVAYGNLVHPDDRDWLWKTCQRALTDRIPCNHEYRIINKAGVTCWVWERAYGVYAPDGSLISLEGFVTDITSRKTAEMGQQATELRYRSLFEGAPDSVFLISAEPADFGVIIDANELAGTSRGYTHAELIGRSIFDLNTPESAQLGPGRIHRLLTGVPLEFESTHRCKDGSLLFVGVTARQVEVAGKKCILSFNRDISDRKRAEAALRESEARWRFALDGAGDGLWDWNIETGAVFFSHRWKSMLGYADEDILPDFAEWERRVHPDDLPVAHAALTAYFAGETESYVCEIRMRRKDGPWHWILARAKVVGWTAMGKPRRLIGTHTDIDQDKRREAARHSLTRRLDLALRAGRFGTFQRNLVTNEVAWDDRALQIFGLSPGAAAPTRAEVAALILPEDLAKWEREYAAAAEGRETNFSVVRVRLPSGEIRHIQGHAGVEQSNDESGAVMTGVFDDITERQIADQERRTLLQRYNSIYTSVAEGLVLQRSEDDGVIDCNPAAERILGLTRNQLLGVSSMDPQWRAVDALNRPLNGADHPSMSVSRTHQPVRGFIMGVHRSDGSMVWLSVNAEPIRDSAGRISQVVTSFTDVTAQRHAEEESRAANEHLQAAVTASRIVWWEWDIIGDDFKINAFGQPCILGYLPHELASINGQRWLEKTHPEDRPVVAKTLTDALAGPADSWVSRHRVAAADGTWRWVRHIGKVRERSAEGKPLLMVGTTQDEHDHYMAEARAQAVAEQLQLTLNASKMGIWRYNLQTEVHEWDDRTVEIFGCTRATMPTREQGFIQFVHPADQLLLEKSRLALREGKRSFEVTYRIVTPQGEIRHIRSVGTVQPDVAGRPEWISGINEDITEYQVQQTVLRDLNERFQMALRASRFGVWELDLKSNYLHWDDALHSIYGVAREQWKGSHADFRSYVVASDRAQMDREFQGILKGTPVDYLEFQITRQSDGALRTIESNGYLLRDAAGVPLRIVGMNRDITDQKQAEAKQRQLESQLMQSQKLETLGTLAGGIAHDFNNLLTGVLGFVDLSLRAVPTQDPVADFLRNAREGGMRARELVKRLLLFARQAPSTARQPLHLGQLVVDTIPLLSASLPASIDIHSDLATAVGPVLADAGQIQQVLMNLGVNAAHAIGTHHGRITLELSLREALPLNAEPGKVGPFACLAVSDTGCGMDEATQARIFDPFFTTKTQGEGTGLGLSIVYGIVRDHGGYVRVQSAPGNGSRFEIYLPIGAEAKKAVQPSAPVIMDVVGGGRRVLIADDEPQVRMLVEVVLRRAGFVFDACDDGNKTSRQFAAAPTEFALALIDLSMPGRTGFELIAEMRVSRPDLPVILMSGDHDRYGRTGGAELENVVRLAKPFSVDELFAALRQALEGSTRTT